MLLERDLIQSVGFRNVREGGEVTGFQFRVRMPSYRGMTASLIDGIAVKVGDLVDVAGRGAAVDAAGQDLHAAASCGTATACAGRSRMRRSSRCRSRAVCPTGVHEVSIELRLRMSYIPVEHQPSTYQVTKHVTLAPEADGAPFKYGVSLYSFMGDYGTVLDLETALAGIADIGATGVEILGEGHIPNYPDPSQEWVDDWFRLLEKYGLEPTNYGSWIDTRLHSSGPNGRDMTVEEGAAALQRDLRLAKRLGFRFVRPKIGVVSSDLIPHPIWTEVVEQSLPLAEELDVIICPEIHSPTPIKHEVVDEYIEFIERTGTKHFGLLIDTGIFQDRPDPAAAGRAAAAASRVHGRHRRSIRPTSPMSPSTSSSSRRSSTTSTTTSTTSRSRGSRCSARSGTPATPASSRASTRASANPWRSIEQVRRQHSLMRQVADAL